MIDVAHGAGVSRATAARVLAGSDRVDPAMTAAVMAEARRLGYETNLAARSLRSGRSGAIGLVVATNELGGLMGNFAAKILQGAVKGLTDVDIQPVIVAADNDNRVTRYLSKGHVDAAIVILQHEFSEVTAAIAASSLPLVWVGRPGFPIGANAAVIDADNYGGGRLAARTLLDSGRQRIAHIAGPRDMTAANDRRQGWQDELYEASITPGPVAYGDFSMAGGTSAMMRIIARSPDVDAVFVSSDLMAAGALRVLQASGRSVPRDVALLGFDDVAVATTTDPPLSSIRQPLEDMGRRAAEMANSLSHGRDISRDQTLPTTLVSRESH
ncbi:LacI family DNA-binding transcriptional regulator [Tessaracoccus defluvii]